MENLTLDEVMNLLGKYGINFSSNGKTVFSGKDILEFLINDKVNYPGILSNGRIVANDIISDFIVAMRGMSLAGFISDYKSNVEGIEFIIKSSYVFKRYLSIYGFGVTFKNYVPILILQTN